MKNRIFALFLTSLAGTALAQTAPQVEMFKSPYCGCCGKWIEHMKQNNFNVKDNIVDDMESIKAKYGVPKELASCHTAIVDGYVIEGHVPAADVMKLLKTKPKVTGLSVPGMVTGSPGMEMGGRVDPYDVMSFDKEKHFQIFNHYEGK